MGIAGGPLDGYGDAVTELKGICSAVADLNARFEDRNRTAPVPFCGNRFEFRAVGSAQNVAFPLAVLNTAVAEGMWKLSSMIEEGLTPRDAVASMLRENFGAKDLKLYEGTDLAGERPELYGRLAKETST